MSHQPAACAPDDHVWSALTTETRDTPGGPTHYLVKWCYQCQARWEERATMEEPDDDATGAK